VVALRHRRPVDRLRPAGSGLLPPLAASSSSTSRAERSSRSQTLDLLEQLLARPYYLSPGWLRIDPTFAPLKGHPRFEKLAAGG